MATVSGIEVKEIGEMVGRGGEPRMHGELYRNGKPFLSFADDLNSIGVTTLNGPDENKKSFAEIAKQDIPKLGLKGMDEFAFINVLMTLDYFETAFDKIKKKGYALGVAHPVSNDGSLSIETPYMYQVPKGNTFVLPKEFEEKNKQKGSDKWIPLTFNDKSDFNL